MQLALSTDHAGFERMGEIKKWLESLGHSIKYFGPKDYNPADDYPEFINPAAAAVANGEAEIGIIIGGSGQGEAMAANRLKNVRCAVYYGPAKMLGATDVSGNSLTDEFEILRLTKKHNNANMLSLGARFLNIEQMKEAIKIWLETPFSGDERHITRIRLLDSL